MRTLVFRFADRLSQRFNTDIRFFMSGSFWLGVLQVITVLGGLATTIAFSNLLEPTTYGSYKYLISLGLLISTFSLSGMGPALQQVTLKGYDGFFKYAMRKNYIFNSVVAIASIGVAIYYFYRGNTLLGAGSLIIALLQPLIVNFQTLTFYLFGKQRFKTVTKIRGLNVVISTLSILGTIFITKNVLILLAVALGSQTLMLFLEYLYYRPKTSDPVPAGVEKKYYHYALHTSVRQLIFNFALRLDSIIVFTHLGATDLAIYAIANLVPDQIKGSFKNLSTLLLVGYSKHDDLTIVKKTIWKRSIQLLVVLVAISILYALLIPYLYALIFPKYHASIFYSQLLALAFPAFIGMIPVSALKAQLKQKELYIMNITNAIYLIASVLFLTYTYGLIGTIIARVSYRYVSTTLSYFLLFSKE